MVTSSGESPTHLDPLRELHAEVQGKVNAALEAMPEYRQMKALEAAIAKMETANSIGAMAAKIANAVGAEPVHTVQGIAAALIRRNGEPTPLGAIFDHLDSIKKYEDKKKARVNVVSVLSKGKMLKAVMWKGKHAWWFANEPLPRNTASSGASA